MDARQKEYLKQKVITVARRNSGSRVKNWILNFHKIIFYKAISFSKLLLPIKVRTLWGEKMEIILPERVSISILRNGFAEVDVTFYLLEYLKTGDTFIDIGAHFGSYSLLASTIVGNEGRVLAFEPTPSTYRQLSKNAINYSNNNIEVFNFGVYDTRNELRFSDYGVVNSAFNTFFVNRGNNSLTENDITVKTIKLDDFFNEFYSDLKIDLLKIDAESSEFKILMGLKETLLKYRPKIILEVGDYSIEGIKKTKDLVAFLENQNYKPYELDLMTYKVIQYQVKENEEYKNIIFHSVN